MVLPNITIINIIYIYYSVHIVLKYISCGITMFEMLQFHKFLFPTDDRQYQK